MIRLQQTWLTFYQRHLCYVFQDAETVKDNTSSSPLMSLPSQSYMTVLCEMAELFLNLYVQRTTKEGVNFCDSTSEEKQPDKTNTDIFSGVAALFAARESMMSESVKAGDDTVFKASGSDVGSNVQYHFRCTAYSLQHTFLPFIKYVLTAADLFTSASCSLSKSKTKTAPSSMVALGSREEVLWVADVLWNMSVLLMKKHLCSLPLALLAKSSSSLSPLDPSTLHGSNFHALSAAVSIPQVPLPISSCSSIGGLNSNAPKGGLMNSNKPKGGSNSNEPIKEKQHEYHDINRYEAGAEALELCQQLYCLAAKWPQQPHREMMDFDDDEQDHTELEGLLSSQCRATLSAIAVRLDINSLVISNSASAVPSCYSPPIELSPGMTAATSPIFASSVNPSSCGDRDDGKKIRLSVTDNISHLKNDFKTIEGLLPTLFKNGLTEDHPFHKLYVMLSLSARLMLDADGWGSEHDLHDNADAEGEVTKDDAGLDQRGHDSVSPAERFVSSHTSSLMALTPLDLIKCADLALCPEAVGGSEVVARGVLRLAVQLLVRETQLSRSSNILLGNLYRRLIELSPDKSDVRNPTHSVLKFICYHSIINSTDIFTLVLIILFVAELILAWFSSLGLCTVYF